MPEQKTYDVLIVGAGISGALMAYTLAKAGKSVLVLDGGPEIPDDRSPYMEQFYLSMAKTPEAPYPVMADDPAPLTLDINTWTTQGSGYLIQKGPLPFSSTYERVAGGTTWHWLGTSLRLLPSDFALYTNYLSKATPPLGDKAMDWPITYDDLEPFYCGAERQIGIAADQVLHLDDQVGLHPNLKSFKALFDKHQLAIVQGVGYPNASRSHFRSMEIWHTAKPTGMAPSQGWLGAFISEVYKVGDSPFECVNFGASVPQALLTQHAPVAALQDTANFQFLVDRRLPTMKDQLLKTFGQVYARPAQKCRDDR